MKSGAGSLLALAGMTVLIHLLTKSPQLKMNHHQMNHHQLNQQMKKEATLACLCKDARARMHAGALMHAHAHPVRPIHGLLCSGTLLATLTDRMRSLASSGLWSFQTEPLGKPAAFAQPFSCT